MLVHSLQRDSYWIEEAPNGVVALSTCGRLQPDLVLLDIMMPLMDGVEACARIRSLPGGEHIPVLMLTALDDPTAIARSFEAGATDYITKPVDLRVLSHRVKHLLKAARARDQLRASESRFRSIIETGADAIILADADLRIRLFNPCAEQIFGCSADDILDQPLDILFAAQSAAGSPPGLRDFIDSIDPGVSANAVFEIRGRRADGTDFPLEGSIGKFEEHGRPMFTLTLRDVTERKQSEADVLKLNEDLAQRAREMAALNKALRAVASTLDLRRVLEIVVHEIQSLLNAERSAVLLRDPLTDDLVFAAVAGQGSEDIVGLRVPIQLGIVGWVARERQSALVGDAACDPRFWGEVDAWTGLSTRSVVAVPIKFQETVWGVAEAINGLEGVFKARDCEMLESLASSAAAAIEHARLYQAEREQTRRLQESQARLIHAEKMSALGRLAASLTHEINNPLQALQSGLWLMREELAEEFDREAVRRDLQIMEDEVSRISNLMSSLREFSRPVQLELRSIHLPQLLETILGLVARHLEQHAITVTTDWDTELPPIMASRDQLTQVFLNLVLNAIDAMPQGGSLALSVRVDRSAATLSVIQIAVTDTGHGIPAEDIPRLFEPFFTTKANGTGLGLAISHEIVRSLGGEIAVASQIGSGATFTVRLPWHEA